MGEERDRDWLLERIADGLERQDTLLETIIAILNRPITKPEPTSFNFVQNLQGENRMAKLKLTNNTIQQGTAGNFSAIPNAGSAFINAPVASVDTVSAGLGVSVATGVADKNGEPTFDVTVPLAVPVGTVITLSGTDQTAAGVVTATPLSITVVAPILPEPTAFSFAQNS